MITKISISNPVEVKIDDAGYRVDNIITISFVNKHTDLYIELSEDNYKELKRAINEN